MSDSRKVRLILGSASPRRLELLSRFFPEEQIEVWPAALDEAKLGKQLIARDPDTRPAAGSPGMDTIACELAKAKLQILEAEISQRESQNGEMRIMITADTLVILDDQIMGKPQDALKARQMLRQLSGREHRVVTGLCVRVICDKESRLFLATEQTQVTFGDLTAAKIDWYVATGEPLDKAGAYGIQGYGSALVKSIRGCYYNVVGLPVFRLLELFEQARQAFPLLQDSLQFLPW